MSILFRIRRGLRANLPTLAEGEPGFTTDEKKLYIGTSSGNIELSKATDLALKADKSKTINITITTWIGDGPYYATAAVSGVPADGSGVEVGLADTATKAQYEAAAAAMIWPTTNGWAANTIALVAFGDKPTIALPITVKVLG